MTAPENSLSHKSLDIASWKEEGGRSEEEQQRESERDAAAAVKGEEERGANGQKTSFSLCHIEYIECIKRRTDVVQVDMRRNSDARMLSSPVSSSFCPLEHPRRKSVNADGRTDDGDGERARVSNLQEYSMDQL